MRRATLRRAAALWVLLAAVFASTVGLHAFRGADYAGDEPHYLLTAKSLVEDRSPDLLDEFRARDYGDIYPEILVPRGALTKGMLNEPHGLGFPLLIAPAYAVAGPKGVELFMAAVAALAIALAYALALRVVPDPWAFAAALMAGLSPPLVAYSTAVYPAMAAGALLAGAALLALRLSEQPSRRSAFGCFALLGALPWLSPMFVAPGAVIAVFAVRELWLRRRRMLAIGAAEVVGFSLAFYAGLSDGLFGGLTPYAAQLPGASPTGATGLGDHLDRAYRLVALWIDRDYGLLRWAPLFALAFVGLWLAWRERRGGLARVIPELRHEETAAALCACVAGVQLMIAAFLAPTMFGFWFPGRHLVPALPLLVPLVALGLRKLPRLGALLGALGVVASVWLWIAVRWDGAGLAADRPRAPWGPLDAAFPLFAAGALPYVIAALIGVALAAVFFVPERAWRQLLRRARVGAAGLLAAAVAVALVPARAHAAREVVGHSADGRPITAVRLGDADNARKALVVGAIHGDERGGLAVTRELRRRWASRLHGVDLWVVDTFNPDGLRRGTRQNARAVDLNRNFPYRWRRNGRRGSRYWGGPKPLSEPESRAIRQTVLHVRPAVTIWYHQPWNAVLACGREVDIEHRYARLAGAATSCRGGGLSGTATSWENNVVGGGTAFVVELAGGRISETTARRHARAAALVTAAE
jgi:hypothetical protein